MAECHPAGSLLRRYVHGAAEEVDDPPVTFEGAGTGMRHDKAGM